MKKSLQKIIELAFEIDSIATKQAIKNDNSQPLNDADYFTTIKIFAERIEAVCCLQLDKKINN